jgi:hypothetical protein
VSAAGLAGEIYALALVAQGEWAEHAIPGVVGPASPAEVGAALHVVDAEDAIELMTHLSADDLVFSGHPLQDRNRTRGIAVRVVNLLGREATWASVWAPVTRHTFDGVIAGADENYFVVLLQVGED